ncbi:DinB family protein [Sessilibacter corallicola]|uniref:DinB family protein n=1 Tax=Sessilibacter corallicola TaxID=2904075 RepID=A0ABQ0A9Q3_9GAMM|nr:DinB family protein [Sessilibacter corallicola]MCE2029313.1 damage-inducible protein DinB [Sessilibacter corallicola]
MPLSYFRLLANHNQRMNNDIYDAASRLAEKQLPHNNNKTFTSIISTLNHILVSDTIWLKRFSQHPAKLSSLEYVQSLDNPSAPDVVLYEDFYELSRIRRLIDAMIIQFVQELSDNLVASPMTYKTVRGEKNTKLFGHLLLHFFNTQTYYRGRASALFSEVGINIAVSDLLMDIPTLDR